MRLRVEPSAGRRLSQGALAATLRQVGRKLRIQTRAAAIQAALAATAGTILLSQPGLGVVLAARVLGEFGDDRLADACTL